MPLELGVHTKDHRNASQVPIPKPNHSEDMKNQYRGCKNYRWKTTFLLVRPIFRGYVMNLGRVYQKKNIRALFCIASTWRFPNSPRAHCIKYRHKLRWVAYNTFDLRIYLVYVVCFVFVFKHWSRFGGSGCFVRFASNRNVLSLKGPNTCTTSLSPRIYVIILL